MFGSITHRLRAWRLRNITRRRLALLDDRLLFDIGTTRKDIDTFVDALPASDLH